MRTLIENLDFVLTVDSSDRVLRRASVVVDGDRIAAIVPASDADSLRGQTFDQVLDGRRLGMCPGFVDAHVHLSETLSRAVFPDDIDTRTWVFYWAKPFYARVGEDDERCGAMLACAEMLRSGTTCFLDMGAQNDPGIVVGAVESAGIRGVTGRHAADVVPERLPEGWTQEMVRHHFFDDAKSALAALRDAVERWHGAAGGRIRCWVNIEGKEPCSLELHVGARALAEQLGVGTTYHLATSVEEARIAERKYGKRPVQRVADAGGLGSNLVIAHGTALDDAECELIRAAGTKIAFCPGTSLKLAKGAAAIGKYPELLEAGVTVALGTDGVSASGNLNLMRQMYVAAGLFKDARNDAALVGARRALRMATIDGARALGWDDEIGSLEPGKKADFILFDLDHVEWSPFHDPLQALVWSASTASIAQTWVDGRCLYRNGKVLTIDERALYAEARERAAAIVARAGLAKDGPSTYASVYE